MIYTVGRNTKLYNLSRLGLIYTPVLKDTRMSWHIIFNTKKGITSCIAFSEFMRGVKELRIFHRQCLIKFMFLS